MRRIPWSHGDQLSLQTEHEVEVKPYDCKVRRGISPSGEARHATGGQDRPRSEMCTVLLVNAANDGSTFMRSHVALPDRTAGAEYISGWLQLAPMAMANGNARLAR